MTPEEHQAANERITKLCAERHLSYVGSMWPTGDLCLDGDFAADDLRVIADAMDGRQAIREAEAAMKERCAAELRKLIAASRSEGDIEAAVCYEDAETAVRALDSTPANDEQPTYRIGLPPGVEPKLVKGPFMTEELALKLIAQEVAAMKERCAQVADRESQTADKIIPGSGQLKAKLIAAEIRALE